MENDSLLYMDSICKRFSGITALDHVSFRAKAGEIHALMGENGAGKSTLIKILAGAYTKDADSGDISINGKKVDITSPRSALNLGISVIYQELALIPHLTVAENIFIDHLSERGTMVAWKQIRADAHALLKRLGFEDIDVMKPVSTLPVAYMQIVEIAKALSRDSKIIVFDEPTAVLTAPEVEKLFTVIRELKQKGVLVVYVSHRIKEIFALCDRITVLKDGKYVNCVNVPDTDSDSLVAMMVGRKNADRFSPAQHRVGDKIVFEAKGLCCKGLVEDVSFFLRQGEVLGVSGLVGAGRTETMQLIFGARKKDAGEIYINGKRVAIRSPKQAVRHGVGMVPEDRKGCGVLLEMPIYENGTISIIQRLTKALGVIDRKKEMSVVHKLVNELQVKTADVRNSVSTLSGGNQQKVSLMKWLAAEGKILILDEPTRGVDVGAKSEIYRIIDKLASEGVSIIMVSSELTEIINVCDRTLVMRQGRLCSTLKKEETTEQNLIKLELGVAQANA